MTNDQLTIGLIVGNRDFFPTSLAIEGRTLMMATLARHNVRVVALSDEETEGGLVATWDDAKKCADLFKREALDGVVVSLPNFGDERSIVNSIRLAGLRVPILVQAFPDEIGRMGPRARRDSFCGKISVCNNLTQYGLPFSLTARHTVHPDDPAFDADIERFAQTCRVVKAVPQLRIGAVGARPGNFHTVRYSEKLLEASGISVVTIDLSDILGQISKLSDGDDAVALKLEEIQAYTPTRGIPNASLVKMAKLGVVTDRWMRQEGLNATAFQCWTALQNYFGIVPCTIMSMMGNNLLPSACEVDVTGLVSMYLLQAASGQPSAILDWNNNFGDDPDKAIVFHCSNLPKHFFGDDVRMAHPEIIATVVGKENSYGTLEGRISPGPFTFMRVTTDDTSGRIRTYVGRGRFTDDPLAMFGGFGIAHIPNLQNLLQFVCRNGFEHHVAVNLSRTVEAVAEALERYIGWDVHVHG